MHSVLIIDDQPELLDVTRLFLEKYGEMSVRTAASAKGALSLMKEMPFDALVVDIDLPEISGLELLKILRAKGDTTPVIIFTGVGRELAAIEALNNGADFFLQKGDEPHAQFRTMVHMINQAVERRSMGRAIGTSQKLLARTISFFSEPAYATDREGKVIAWNRAMTSLTGIEQKKILGKGGGECSVPFFGHRMPMLTDLVFEKDATIAKNGYTIINKDQGSIIAWTRGRPKKEGEKVWWMKASALHDGKGIFIGSIGSVRDITEELGAELLRQAAGTGAGGNAVQPAPVASAGMRLDKLLGKARTNYRKGLHLSFREGNYEDAIPFFDQAIGIDPSLAPAWYDRGICLRELGRDEEALKNFDRSVELAPDNEEFTFTRADMLKKIGILRQQANAIEAAARAYDRVLTMNPDHAEAWNGLGICMRELGREESARQYFERSQDLVRKGRSKTKTRKLDTIV